MLTVIFLFFLSSICYGQNQLDNLPVARVVGTRFSNPATGVKELEYSEIKGNCFWDKDWNAALLVLKMGGDVKLKKVKLNLYTNDIHYQDNTDKEMVALNGVTKVMFFDKKDTTKVSAVFQWFASFAKKKKEAFAQVLAVGDIQFVKNYIVSLHKEFESSNYRFITTTDYSIIDRGNVFPLKSINKRAILSIIKPSKEREEWLQSNKNKLKNEADVIAFITFCNSNLEPQ